MASPEPREPANQSQDVGSSLTDWLQGGCIGVGVWGALWGGGVWGSVVNR
jgi:hypothetical protein